MTFLSNMLPTPVVFNWVCWITPVTILFSLKFFKEQKSERKGIKQVTKCQGTTLLIIVVRGLPQAALLSLHYVKMHLSKYLGLYNSLRTKRPDPPSHLVTLLKRGERSTYMVNKNKFLERLVGSKK